MHSSYLSAQTAFYSLNPDRDIPGPLAINPAYIRLAANHITAQGIGYPLVGQPKPQLVGVPGAQLCRPAAIGTSFY